MANESFEWIKIAESVNELQFNDQNLAEVEIAVRKFCIGRFENKLFAFAPKCPHASAHFINGYIYAMGNVVCPLHRYKFFMANGRNITGEGYFLKHWQVEAREDGVFVRLEKEKLFGLF